MKLFIPDDTLLRDADPGLMAAVYHGDLPAVRQRLAEGAPIDGWDEDNLTALMIAAREGDVDIVEQLLQAGADPYLECQPNMNSLMLALHHRQPAIVRLWIEFRLDVNVENPRWGTPLMTAVCNGDLEMVRLLLRAGANVNAADAAKQTALSLALQNGLEEIAAVLKKAGGVVNPEDAFHAEMGLPEIAVPDFRLLAQQPSFRELQQRLQEEYGWSVSSWDDLSGVCRVHVNGYLLPARLAQVQEDIRKQGFYLLRSALDVLDASVTWLLFPSPDKYGILAALKTDATNYGISTRKLIDWLQKLEHEYPFGLLGAGHDFIEGRFLETPRYPEVLAEKLYAFCPDIVEQGSGTVLSLAADLERTGKLFLWWD